ncbi:putative transcription factor WD40-like family [Helianthus annuus]|nr:putative transcription factor WD40-like family [Helianthus annuus]
MEKYAVPVAPIGENPKPITRYADSVVALEKKPIELNGKPDRRYLHDVTPRLMQSYSEIGVFPHKYKYHNEGTPCKTHFRQYYRFVLDEPPSVITGIRQSVLGVSALEFDAKGIYLASVSKPGCLTVHEFESLYCQSNGSGTREDQGKQLLHIPVFSGANAVRWNPASQDEVVCTSLINNEVLIFDTGYVSSEPTEVLRKRPTVNVHGSSVRQGFSDIALSNDDARVLASDTYGAISIWDRRASNLPQSGLTTNAIYGLTSIQLDENQVNYLILYNIHGGFIYIWDLRGGRSSAAFQSHKEAQSNILPKEIQSININPSCSYQLGFHLDDGWSGVLDLHNFQIYAVGSTSNNGLHLLDFYPHTSSPCHVDYEQGTSHDSKNPGETLECKQNVFIPLSGLVTACATHPLNGTIVAGTVEASLLMISQKHLCKKGDDDDMMATLSIHERQ